MKAGLRRSLRWCTTAASRDTLYPVNGKVMAFATDELAAKVGLRSGDRVRSYAGNKIGQMGVVVGMRNGALFVKWGEDTRLQGHALRDLPRLDVRYVDHVGMQGLNEDEYKEGDRYAQPLYTHEEMERKGRIGIELDDASIQHVINEKPCEEPCQLSEERANWLAIESAVDGIGLAQHLRSRVLRLLSLESDSLGKLNSRRSVDQAIQAKMEEDAKRSTVALGKGSTPVEALGDILQDRVAAFDSLHRVQVGGVDYAVPGALVTRVVNYTLKDAGWVSSLVPVRSAYSGSMRQVAEKHVVPDLGVPLRDVAEAMIAAIAPDAGLDEYLAAANLGADAEAELRAAMLFDIGVYKPINSLPAELDSNVNHDRVIALTGVLRDRLGKLALHVTVEDAKGKRLTVPREALEQQHSEDCVIADAPWARAVLDSNTTLSSEQKQQANEDEIYGKQGRVTTSKTPAGLNVKKDVASQLLHQLSIFHGRHLVPQIPRADVYIPDGEYKYLSRACAVELYAGAERVPQMFCAKGMEEYKSNAWHQPFNMVNEYGLEQWARKLVRGRRGHSRRVHYAHEFPGANIA
eukprot:TRINITY_DN6312_c1_g1_i1.p1 TRINITY_DN6312_c1_g1~~TRINITY_DN6312_c1_g1_i1.p1  ORF type:complete len:576 (+),score=178.72 TRINITY_DN6312_c1_g1_i1:85-1812(+)